MNKALYREIDEYMKGTLILDEAGDLAKEAVITRIAEFVIADRKRTTTGLSNLIPKKSKLELQAYLRNLYSDGDSTSQ